MSKIYYFHTPAVHGIKGLHRYTVAGVFIENPIKDKPASLQMAFSRCSTRDQFSKKLGRAIAEGRLKKMKAGWAIEIPAVEEDSGKEFLVQAIGFIRSLDKQWNLIPMTKDLPDKFKKKDFSTGMNHNSMTSLQSRSDALDSSEY